MTVSVLIPKRVLVHRFDGAGEYGVCRTGRRTEHRELPAIAWLGAHAAVGPETEPIGVCEGHLGDFLVIEQFRGQKHLESWPERDVDDARPYHSLDVLESVRALVKFGMDLRFDAHRGRLAYALSSAQHGSLRAFEKNDEQSRDKYGHTAIVAELSERKLLPKGREPMQSPVPALPPVFHRGRALTLREPSRPQDARVPSLRRHPFRDAPSRTA
jgi:hypothetical protein